MQWEPQSLTHTHIHSDSRGTGGIFCSMGAATELLFLLLLWGSAKNWDRTHRAYLMLPCLPLCPPSLQRIFWIPGLESSFLSSNTLTLELSHLCSLSWKNLPQDLHKAGWPFLVIHVWAKMSPFQGPLLWLLATRCNYLSSHPPLHRAMFTSQHLSPNDQESKSISLSPKASFPPIAP